MKFPTSLSFFAAMIGATPAMGIDNRYLMRQKRELRQERGLRMKGKGKSSADKSSKSSKGGKGKGSKGKGSKGKGSTKAPVSVRCCRLDALSSARTLR